MALNLSDLTSPSTSDDVLSDIYTTADQGDGIALMDDLSDNSIDATQTTANHQPIAFDADNNGPFARFDGSDDRMSFTLASPITNGTVFFATKKGCYAANLDLTAGTYDFTGNKISNNYIFDNDLVALYLFDYELTDAQIAQLKSYFVAKGAVADYGAVTNFRFAWRNCSSLTSFQLIDTSSGSVFYLTWSNCTSLTSFPSNFFDNWNPTSISSGVFNATWDGCSSLTSQSVENILTSINASGKHATSTGASGGTALADPVIDIDYDGSGLTPATTAAIANLKGKGWGITINGTLQ